MTSGSLAGSLSQVRNLRSNLIFDETGKASSVTGPDAESLALSYRRRSGGIKLAWASVPE
jgi:hypothetical protein